MHALPANRESWFGLLLFPFKAFVVIGPVCFWIWLAVNGPARGARTEAGGAVVVGLVVCIPVFIVAALIQVIARRRHAALVSLGFALAAFLILWFWALPMSATS
jgi:uncharacterized membrane protein